MKIALTQAQKTNSTKGRANDDLRYFVQSIVISSMPESAARSDRRCLKIGPCAHQCQKKIQMFPLLTRVIVWDSTAGCQFYS